jgi:hypothetical protein
LLKAYILFEDEEYFDMFQEAYHAVMTYVRDQNGYFYHRVNMQTGVAYTNWVDSLGAFWPGLQALFGDTVNAIKSYEVYYSIWKRFSALPERFDYVKRLVEPHMGHYPLRPELIESTYMIYQVTGNNYYLEAGIRMMNDLQTYARTKCGFASIDNVVTKKGGDRMESFFLGETLKYLYLLFDDGNPVNTDRGGLVFTTEAHPLFLPDKYRMKSNTTGSVTLGQCKIAGRSSSPFIESPLSPREVAKIHSLVGLVSPIPSFDETCLASEEGFESSSLEIMLKSDEAATLALPKLTKIRNGDFLADTLHGVRLLLTSTPRKTYRLRRIGSVDVDFDQKVFVNQKELVMFNGHKNFVDEGVDSAVILMAYDEQSAGKSVMLEFEASSALFGPSAQSLSAVNGPNIIPGIDAPLMTLASNKFGCAAYTRQESLAINGSVVLVRRGECFFQQKVYNAQVAGAVAVVIGNHENTRFVMSVSDQSIITIPSVLVTNRVTNVLGNLLSQEINIHIQLFPGSLVDPLEVAGKESRSLLGVNDMVVENVIIISFHEYSRLHEHSQKPAIHRTVMIPQLRPGMSFLCLTRCRPLKNSCCSNFQ